MFTFVFYKKDQLTASDVIAVRGGGNEREATFVSVGGTIGRGGKSFLFLIFCSTTTT